MDKSGSRPTQPHQLIIDSPGFLRQRDKWTGVGITLFFWLLLLYMWQPALSFLAWLFQAYFFEHHMITLGGYQSFAASALDYLLFILLMNSFFLLWARISLWRFRDRDRRSEAPKVNIEEQSRYFGVDPRAVDVWRSYRQMVVNFDAIGNIVGATPSSLHAFRHPDNKIPV